MIPKISNKEQLSRQEEFRTYLDNTKSLLKELIREEKDIKQKVIYIHLLSLIDYPL